MAFSRRTLLTAATADVLTAAALAAALHFGLAGAGARPVTVHPAPAAAPGDFVWPAAAPADFVWPGLAPTPAPTPAPAAPQTRLTPADFVWPGSGSGSTTTPPPPAA